MTRFDRPRMTDQPSIRFGLATAAVVGLLLCAAGFGLGERESAAAVGVSCVGLGRALPRPLAPCLAVVAWAFTTGFVVNTLGQLTFETADLRRLGAFVLVGLAGALLPRGTSLAEPRTRDRSRLYREGPPLTSRARLP